MLYYGNCANSFYLLATGSKLIIRLTSKWNRSEEFSDCCLRPEIKRTDQLPLYRGYKKVSRLNMLFRVSVLTKFVGTARCCIPAAGPYI
jgi:hypothetical protein